MFDYIKKFLEPQNHQLTSDVKPNNENKILVAACALFIELASADDDFSIEERKLIINIMQNRFTISKQLVEELIKITEREIKDSTDLYHFTTQINENFSKEEKLELMLNLWRLVFVDKKLDKYEDYFIKKIGNLLNLEHKEIIGAKMFVKEEMNNK